MDENFRWRVKYGVKVILALTIVVSAFVLAPDVFFLIFAGILFAILLRSLSDTISASINIPAKWSLGIVLLGILLAISLSSIYVAPRIAEQFDVLTQKIPESVGKLQSYIEKYSWGRELLKEANAEKLMSKSGQVVSGVGGAFSTLLGLAANFVIILFIGLYGAIEPGVYKRGLLHLIPLKNRSRTSEVLNELNDTLRWWLVGKFFGMAVIGILTTVGLWFLDVPLAIILGLIAAIFTFIPNIGPVISAVPAILLGLTESPELALYVGLLYFGIQIIESYLLTPLVEKKAISISPGLTLSAQVLFGFLFGGIGLALAMPVTAAGMVLIQMLYVEDVLGDYSASEKPN